jgi:ParB family chromosome partitioning protein
MSNKAILNQRNVAKHALSVQKSVDEAPDAAARNTRRAFFARLDEIRTGGSHQPRKTFSREELEALARSMNKSGLIQPILIQKIDADKDFSYDLIAGERRFRAAQMLGWKDILAFETDGNPHEVAMLENLQRQDLNAIEEADGLHAMHIELQYSQERLADALGLSQQEISRRLSLRSLPNRVKAEYFECYRDVSKSILIEVVRCGSEAEQLALWDKVKTGGMTVKAMREIKKSISEPIAADRKPVATLLSSADKCFKAISHIRKEKASLQQEDRIKLEKLRDDISSLLEGAET